MSVASTAPRERFLDVDGATVHVAQWSPTGSGSADLDANGAPVLLVHGLGGSTINWHLVGQPFADALGVTVTALDLFGFGRTPLAGRRSTVGANAKLLAAVARATGSRVVVGSSMGGSVAVRAAAQEPVVLDALVLVNPALPFARGNPSPRDVRNLVVFAAASLPLAGPLLMDLRARRIGAAGVVDSSLRASRVDPVSMDQDVRAALVALTEWRHANGVASRAYHDAIRSLLPYLTTAMQSDLAAVQVPTLVVHGREDNLVPLGLATAVARRRPEWDVEVLDCGHLPLLEMPETLVDVVVPWVARAAAGRGR
jgi:pimeloyl-ACP methyl ester carboxylesterase